MRKDCQSQTEQLILNDKLLNFFIESHNLKKYEDDKKKMMKAEINSPKGNSKKQTIGAGESINLLDDNAKTKWEALAKEKQDYSSFLSNFNPEN